MQEKSNVAEIIKEKKRNSLQKIVLVIFGSIILGSLLLWGNTLITNELAHEIVKHISVTFMVVASLHSLLHWAVVRDLSGIVTQTTRVAVAEFVNENETYKKIGRYGMVDIHPTLNYQYLESLLETGRSEISILTIYFHEPDVFTSALKRAIIKHNCPVRILILDPEDHLTLKRREHALNITVPNTIKGNIGRNWAHLIMAYNDLPSDKRHLLQCYFHSEWVALSIYRCDETTIFGHYMTKASTLTHHFIIKGETTVLHDELGQHFNTVWKNTIKFDNNNLFIRPMPKEPDAS